MNVVNNILNVKWKITDVFIVYILSVFSIIIVAVLMILPFVIDLSGDFTFENVLKTLTKHFYLVGLIFIVSSSIMAIVPIIWIKIKNYGNITTLGLHFDAWIKSFLIGLICGLGFRLILLLPVLILKGILIVPSRAAEITQVEVYLYWFRFVSLVILGPISESILFTGFAFPAFAKKFNVKIGAIITAIFFALSHSSFLYKNINFGVLFWLFLAQLIQIWLYCRRKSLIAPIGFHMIDNACTFIKL